MNFKTIEKVAENPKKQWYYNQTEISCILGCGRVRTGTFLDEYAVPHYCMGKSKMYFLPDVLEAVEKTRGMAG